MEIDVTQALKDTENALRDFIASVLIKKYGTNWIEQCGITPDKVKKWQERKAVEEKRQKFGVVDERLIYYANFDDLKPILHKNWSEFSEALGDWKTVDVWLNELGRLRDPDAHRRELLPHQRYLAMGIAGEIRTRLVRYRSKEETSEDYYPRIECVRDNYGNIIPAESGDKLCVTKTKLRPGDIIDFVITASDPLGEELEYMIRKAQYSFTGWQKSNLFSVELDEFDVRKQFPIEIFIRSTRKYHARGNDDDMVIFVYEVLPPKTKQ